MSVSALYEALVNLLTDHASILVGKDQLVEALREDDRQRLARGYRERFVASDGDSVRLRAPSNIAESQLEMANAKAKADLLQYLTIDYDPYAFEKLVAQVLTRSGYTGVRVTPPSKDGGVDIFATLTAGGVAQQVPTAVQVKRQKQSVGVEAIRELRGSSSADGHGLVVVTTSSFTKGAVREATRGDRPVHLIDGTMLVDLLVQFGLGVHTTQLLSLSLDEDFLISSPRQSAVVEASDFGSGAILPIRSSHLLAQLPKDPGFSYLETIIRMLQLAEGQPLLEEYIKRFQERFPAVTLIPEARRRMRVLVSLGLVIIENGHVIITFVGQRLVNEGDQELLHEAFTSRIAGAREILDLIRKSPDRRALRRDFDENPPFGLSATQAGLVLIWIKGLSLAPSTS